MSKKGGKKGFQIDVDHIDDIATIAWNYNKDDDPWLYFWTSDEYKTQFGEDKSYIKVKFSQIRLLTLKSKKIRDFIQEMDFVGVNKYEDIQKINKKIKNEDGYTAGICLEVTASVDEKEDYSITIPFMKSIYINGIPTCNIFKAVTKAQIDVNQIPEGGYLTNREDVKLYIIILYLRFCEWFIISILYNLITNHIICDFTCELYTAILRFIFN